jgi:hypothetical protein
VGGLNPKVTVVVVVVTTMSDNELVVPNSGFGSRRGTKPQESLSAEGSLKREPDVGYSLHKRAAELEEGVYPEANQEKLSTVDPGARRRSATLAR